MRTRTILTATVTAVLPAAFAAIPLAGVAAAATPTDRECRDFASQAAAQSALRSHSGDPVRLDPDHNGMACEAYFRTGSAAADPGDAAPTTAPTAEPTTEPTTEPTDEPTTEPTTDPTADDPAPVAGAVPPAGAPGEASVKTGAPADAAVRTVPERQILAAPRGAADTGDGSTSSSDATPVVLLAGGLAATVALGGGYRLTRRSR